MTVHELQKKLEQIDPDTHIAVLTETDEELTLFEITEVSLCAGSPQKNEYTQEAGFTFDPNGAVKWLFLSTERA